MYCQVSRAETPVNQVRYLWCIDLVTFSTGPKSSFPQVRTISPSSWCTGCWKLTVEFFSGHCPQPQAAASPKVTLSPGCSLHPVTSSGAYTKTQSSRFDLSQFWKATPAPECLAGSAETFIAASSQLDFSYPVLLPSLPSRACCWEDPQRPSCRQVSTSSCVPGNLHQDSWEWPHPCRCPSQPWHEGALG